MLLHRLHAPYTSLCALITSRSNTFRHVVHRVQLCVEKLDSYQVYTCHMKIRLFPTQKTKRWLTSSTMSCMSGLLPGSCLQHPRIMDVACESYRQIHVCIRVCEYVRRKRKKARHTCVWGMSHGKCDLATFTGVAISPRQSGADASIHFVRTFRCPSDCALRHVTGSAASHAYTDTYNDT